MPYLISSTLEAGKKLNGYDVGLSGTTQRLVTIGVVDWLSAHGKPTSWWYKTNSIDCTRLSLPIQVGLYMISVCLDHIVLNHSNSSRPPPKSETGKKVAPSHSKAPTYFHKRKEGFPKAKSKMKIVIAGGGLVSFQFQTNFRQIFSRNFEHKQKSSRQRSSYVSSYITGESRRLNCRQLLSVKCL